VALRCVYEIAASVHVPIIGIGGILTGTDAVEMLSAGATAVGVGSAIFYRGEDAFSLIRDELERWLRDRGYGGIEQVRGRALRQREWATTNPPPMPRWESENG
jgi:dihydroorotate dehydrogenase (NAD+) catalytic subunit